MSEKSGEAQGDGGAPYMRNVIFAINITADGYCGHTDGIADEELHDYFTQLLRNSDTILFGRTTYELMVPYWPDVVKSQSESHAINEFARVFDSLEKVVFSTTLKEASHNSRIARANPADEVLALKAQPGKSISVGSLSIVSQLSLKGLIDEYRFLIHPVVAGKGPRLFETVTLQDKLRLELQHSKTFQSGVVALHYHKRQ